MSANDPFLASAETLEEFKRGHPALEFVASGWTGWVQPWIRGVSASADLNTARKDESPLKILGYRVGANGLDENKRRAKLKQAFEEQLPLSTAKRICKNGTCHAHLVA